MDTSSTTGTDEVIFVHDEEGNDYIVPRSTLQHAKVPADLKSDILEAINPEISGYNYDDFKASSIYIGCTADDKTGCWFVKLPSGHTVGEYAAKYSASGQVFDVKAWYAVKDAT